MALKKAARKLNYNLKITNIYDKNLNINWDEFDGIVIPGGEDIAPMLYINNLPEDLQEHIRSLDSYVNYSKSGLKRDYFEYNLLQEYFSRSDLTDKPILGICRGMQMLGVSQGIPLYIDIKKELGFRNRRYTLDKITVSDNHSLIHQILEPRRNTFRGFENHHQGLRLDYFLENKNQWPHLSIPATSNGDTIAEVLEFNNGRPVLGVQFHPELTLGKVRRNTFKWLLNKACEHKNNRLK